MREGGRGLKMGRRGSVRRAEVWGESGELVNQWHQWRRITVVAEAAGRGAGDKESDEKAVPGYRIGTGCQFSLELI